MQDDQFEGEDLGVPREPFNLEYAREYHPIDPHLIERGRKIHEALSTFIRRRPRPAVITIPDVEYEAFRAFNRAEGAKTLEAIGGVRPLNLHIPGLSSPYNLWGTLIHPESRVLHYSTGL